MQTLTSRIRQDNVRADAEGPTDPPAWAEGGGMTDGYWWKVTLRRKGRQCTTFFHMGPALCREPTAEDVLECMLSDASSADQSFEDWAGDYGYDTDSRKAERTYQQVVAQTDKLRRFLGRDFSAYVYETEMG